MCAIEYGAPTTPAPGLAPSFVAMCAGCSQIVHRDIKAPNVLLREVESRWDVCIADFGAAAGYLERARPWLQPMR
jgi:serine/threonine protein kinase